MVRRTNAAARRLLTASIINLLSLIYMNGLFDGWRASWHRGFETLVAEYKEKSTPVSVLSQTPCQPCGLDRVAARHMDECLPSATGRSSALQYSPALLR